MRRLACRMPSRLKALLDKAVKNDGYGGKGKSRWVREAVDQLFEHDPDLVGVGLGEDLEVNDEEDTFSLSEENLVIVVSGVRLIRSQDPYAEGVQSAIIRAAIRHRLRESTRKRDLLRSSQQTRNVS